MISQPRPSRRQHETGARRPGRGRRPQRRRRQLRRPQGAGRATDRPRDHREQGDPDLVSHRLAEGTDLTTAFRNTVASFEGSVAMSPPTPPPSPTAAPGAPGHGQALYGVADGVYIVASEPYGVIELTDRYLRMDGETPPTPTTPPPAGPDRCARRQPGRHVRGIDRLAYDGTPLPVTEADVATAQITHRDIDRGSSRTSCSRRSPSRPPASARRCRSGIVSSRRRAGRVARARRAAGRRAGGLRDGRSTGWS